MQNGKGGGTERGVQNKGREVATGRGGNISLIFVGKNRLGQETKTD